MTHIKILYPGHRYAISHLDGDISTLIQFVQRGPFHTPQEGIIIQDLLSICIDRINVLDKEDPHPFNDTIQQHLRQAFVLLESRALSRKVQKHQLKPECIARGKDGHFILREEL